MRGQNSAATITWRPLRVVPRLRLGEPMNPNGGLLARFAGLSLPSLGQTFYGATPPNTVWPTHIYTLEYDGIADWPQYPINIICDLNAFAGLYYVHGLYPFLDPSALPPGL
ncbi:hypothetical protein MGAST_18190 [Mycobacterium gastri 'Wayne']|uniref:PE-PPE domain-containing protein n=1 Tax=Mycobacterium gastri TaxID=1777 RepID=A0A1X1VPW5_MYCGS|nr:hypothetical protein MGAST_18190 [Mycobacterium gastri 'Wayne']ORV71113.1 hypothetical protein AWC07_05035 [Mycobacterium gastri]